MPKCTQCGKKVPQYLPGEVPLEATAGNDICQCQKEPQPGQYINSKLKVIDWNDLKAEARRRNK